MKSILKRLKEPSTWAGIAGLAVLFGVDPYKADVLVQAIGGVAGALAVLMPEKLKAGE